MPVCQLRVELCRGPGAAAAPCIPCTFETCEATRPAATTLPVCRDEWTALGPVIEALGFDFYDAEGNMAPVAVDLTARITAPGIWNAVAFWFELQLDEGTRLDSGPYCDKVRDVGSTHMSRQLMLLTASCMTDRSSICDL